MDATQTADAPPAAGQVRDVDLFVSPFRAKNRIVVGGVDLTPITASVRVEAAVNQAIPTVGIGLVVPNGVEVSGEALVMLHSVEADPRATILTWLGGLDADDLESAALNSVAGMTSSMGGAILAWLREQARDA